MDADNRAKAVLLVDPRTLFFDRNVSSDKEQKEVLNILGCPLL